VARDGKEFPPQGVLWSASYFNIKTPFTLLLCQGSNDGLSFPPRIVCGINSSGNPDLLMVLDPASSAE
jgi:hypothetical protein